MPIAEETARPVIALVLPVDLVGVWEGYEYRRPLYKHELTFSPGTLVQPAGTYYWRVSVSAGVVKSTFLLTGYTTHTWKFLRWYKGRWNLRPTPKFTTTDADRWTLHLTEEAASDSSSFGPGVAPVTFVVWGPDEVTIGRVTYLRRGGSPKVTITAMVRFPMRGDVAVTDQRVFTTLLFPH